MNAKWIILACRIGQAFLMLLIIALVGAGSGFCITVASVESCGSAPIGDWKDLKGDLTRIKGQYFVFLFGFFLMLGACVALALGFGAVGALLLFLFFVLEVWYASGFGMGSITVASWGAACFFCLVAEATFVADVIFTFLTKD